MLRHLAGADPLSLVLDFIMAPIILPAQILGGLIDKLQEAVEKYEDGRAAGRGVFGGRIMLGYRLVFSHPIEPWHDAKLSRLRAVFLNGSRVLPPPDKLRQ